MEQVAGIEPVSPPWEGGIITFILYLRLSIIILHSINCFVKNKKRVKIHPYHLAPGSKGIPSAFGALDFFDVNARMIMVAI